MDPDKEKYRLVCTLPVRVEFLKYSFVVGFAPQANSDGTWTLAAEANDGAVYPLDRGARRDVEKRWNQGVVVFSGTIAAFLLRRMVQAGHAKQMVF